MGKIMVKVNIYSEKATKIWCHLPQGLYVTNYFFWPTQKT